MSTRAGRANQQGTSSRANWILEVPSSFVVVLAAHTLLQQIAALVGLEIMRSPVASLLIAGALMSAWWLLARGFAAQSADSVDGRLLASAAMASPVVLLCYAVVARVLLGQNWVEWFLGGDNVRHVVLVSDLIHQGGLTYDNAYPQGWHALLATLWTAQGAGNPADDIVRFVEFVGFSTWALTMLLMLTLAAATIALLQNAHVSGRVAYTGVVLTGSIGLLPRITSDYLALGFQTSILSALVLGVVVRETLQVRPKTATLATMSACCIAIAHAWQVFLPAAVAAFLIACTSAWRQGIPGTRRRVAFSSSVVLLGCSVPVLRLFQTVDAGLIGSPGATPDVPWVFVVLGLGAFVGVSIAIGHWRLACVAAVPIFTPLLTACAAVVALGVGLNDYYPTKMLWTTAVLLVPYLGAYGSIVASSRAPTTIIRHFAIIIAAGTSIVGMIVPAGAFVGGWSTVRSEAVLQAIEARGVSDAEGVWMRSTTESAVTRTLLYVHRPDRSSQTMLDRLTVARECELLRASPDPVVVTTRAVEDAERRYSCADPTVVSVTN